MKILLTNIRLEIYSGTEVYVRDLASALHNLGHCVAVYSPRNGRVANEIRKAGIEVTSSCSDVTFRPDIIHAQHFIPAMDAILRFPGVPVVYFVHDRLSPNDAPPKHSQVEKYVAVDHNCLDRLTIDNDIPPERTAVIYNWVDTGRFKLKMDRPKKPVKALVFSNNARRDNYCRTIRDACREVGLRVDGVGYRLGKMNASPENILGEYDIVFAKAKAAMEAMATGAAVVVCDAMGIGEMVTTANFEEFRRFNFGMRTMTRSVSKDLILNEIRKYDRAESLVVAQMIREQAAFGRSLAQILNLYDEAISAFPRPRDTSEDSATLHSFYEQKAEALLQAERQRSLVYLAKDAIARIDHAYLKSFLSNRFVPIVKQLRGRKLDRERP